LFLCALLFDGHAGHDCPLMESSNA
jgi:hypothetical protein